uniref:Poly [ADP-ribose] polymerase n=1 Tax=Steinernema glaseri TaxID=37863 RepID=A0A1I7ZLS7_9BILA
MRCGLSPLEQSTSEYQMVERYLENTHAPTHSSYKMKIRNVFAVDKHGEKEKLNSSVGNRKLLWHGSRLANWYGILSQGLRIAPPEAPVTGYMFGKGVYFADMSSKSANYCFPQPGKPGFLLLAEVLLGETNDLINSDYNASKLPKGKSSTFGMGRIAPDPAEDLTLPDGCVVPLGKPIEMEGAAKYTLNYNEYIVYNTNQINLKYLVEVDFDFESLL